MKNENTVSCFAYRYEVIILLAQVFLLDRKIILLATLFFCSCFASYGQDNQTFVIDSIKKEIPYQTDYDLVKSYTELSWYYRNFDVDSGLVFARNSLFHAKAHGADSSLAAAYNTLASSFESKGNLDSAEFYFKQSLEKRLEQGDSILVAKTLNNLGILYDQRGLFNISLKNYFRSLRLFENYSKDPYDVAMVLGNIGIVYKKQRAYEQVLEYYQRALDIYIELNNDFGQVVTMGNIGSVLISLERYEEAIEMANEALIGYEKLGYVRYVPYMYHNMAVAYDSLGVQSKAESFYSQSLIGHKEHQNTYELANTLTAYANHRLKQNDNSQARILAKEGLTAARNAKSLEFEVNALKVLAEANARLQNFDEAFLNYKAYASGRDSLFEKDKTRQIFELRATYESDKQEQKIEVQEAKIQRDQGFIISLILLTFLLVMLFILFRSRVKKRQDLLVKENQLKLREAELNAVINSQEKERNRFARDLHDGFGQLISVLKLNLSQLNEVTNRDMEKRAEVFKNGESVINEMFAELRNVCFDLMPQTLIKRGLTSALKEFGTRINQTQKVKCEVLVFDNNERLPNLVEISLFRITQEWVNNVLKYANASVITIQITREPSEITLTIEDNGEGFDKQDFYEGSGNGWKNIQTRLNQINGEFDLDSRQGFKSTMATVNVAISLVPITEKEEMAIT